jgi:hypothetical protein
MTSDSPCCHKTARNCPSVCPTLTSRGYNCPPGIHRVDEVAPTATFAKPIGTRNSSARASPSGGQIEPPSLPSGTGCGSLATAQVSLATLNATMRPRMSFTFSRSSPELVAYDCPATMNSSPTPIGSTVPTATTSSVTRQRNSRRYQPPAIPRAFATNLVPSAPTSSRAQSLPRPDSSPIGTTRYSHVALSAPSGNSPRTTISAYPAPGATPTR